MVGELSSIRHAALPVAGAIGGMLAPALIYHFFNPSGQAASGWGVPMATDIAFAVGILVLLAWRIPRNLIIFLTALAIADDLGAVLVIALFYTQTIDVIFLGAAIGLVGILYICNRAGIRHTLPYVIVGFLLWLTLLKSGIHATLAGVILAFIIPARPKCTPYQFSEYLDEMTMQLREKVDNSKDVEVSLDIDRMSSIAESLEKASSAAQSPQQRLEHQLSPWVTFGVIPLFAMANAGLDLFEISFQTVITKPVTLGVILGLVLGKFVGISSFCWLAVKFGWARLPSGVRWRHILGAAWLGGIGFTMSLFIAQLAFTSSPTLFEETRLGIIMASVTAAFIGLTWLYISARRVAD
jgi:Na+:H+ antiporter, NhaA family